MKRRADLFSGLRFGGLRPEAALLLYGARTRLSLEAKEQAGRLLSGQELDWEVLLGLAACHQVGPLLHRTLQSVCPEAVPPAAKERLSAARHATARNNLFLARGLLRLLRLFAEEGLQAVPFKGPVAAATGYGDLTLRPFTDLDILVRKEEVHEARRALLAEGFEICPDLDSMPTSFGRSGFFGPENFWYEVLKNPEGKAEGFLGRRGTSKDLPVELHWQLAPHYFAHPLPAPLWERLRPVSLLDEEVLTFSAEEMLLHLVLHGTVHRWEKLRLICDVAEMVRSHPDLDWTWTFEEARRRRSERMLLLGLHLAHGLLGAPLPVPVRERAFGDETVRWLAEWVVRRLFQEEQRGLQRWWRAAAYDLRVRDRLKDGMGACLFHTHVLLKTLVKA